MKHTINCFVVSADSGLPSMDIEGGTVDVFITRLAAESDSAAHVRGYFEKEKVVRAAKLTWVDGTPDPEEENE